MGKTRRIPLGEDSDGSVRWGGPARTGTLQEEGVSVKYKDQVTVDVIQALPLAGFLSLDFI